MDISKMKSYAAKAVTTPTAQDIPKTETALTTINQHSGRCLWAT